MHDQITERAAKIGTEHGHSAASWVFDGSTSAETYRAVVRGLDDGDPAIYDMFREPSLSGEYGDDYTEADLTRDLADIWTVEVADPDETLSEAANAYNDAASAAFWAEIERVARYHAGESR